MPRPIHFEIPANDPQRTIAFYEAVFGWKFQKWGNVDYWLISTGDKSEPGIDGGLMPKHHPDQPCVNTVSVANLEESLGSIQTNGGQCVVPRMPIPGVGWLAYCKDTEGHIFGIMQADPAAA